MNWSPLRSESVKSMKTLPREVTIIVPSSIPINIFLKFKLKSLIHMFMLYNYYKKLSSPTISTKNSNKIMNNHTNYLRHGNWFHEILGQEVDDSRLRTYNLQKEKRGETRRSGEEGEKRGKNRCLHGMKERIS